MTLLRCEFVSPSQKLSIEGLDLITLPGQEGELGIFPNHAPMIIALKSGIIHLYKNKDIFQHYFIDKGFASITSSACIITCPNFSLLEELDPKVLEAEIKRYHDDLAGLSIEDEQRILHAKILLAEKMLEALKKKMQVK